MDLPGSLVEPSVDASTGGAWVADGVVGAVVDSSWIGVIFILLFPSQLVLK